MRSLLFTLGFVLLSVLSVHSQPYNYTLEGFDNVIFPAATPGPTVETQYVSPTGAWSIFRGYTVTGSDPCPNDGTNRALRFLSANPGYVITPTLLQGVATMTFNTARTNKNLTYSTSIDNGITWSTPITINSGTTACNTLTVTLNSGIINRIKIANLGNDVGIDNLLITSFTIVAPSVTTTTASAITFTTATSGGNVTFDGGAPVTARGVCWSTTPNPTIANSLTSNGTGLGSFTSNLAGLSPGTTYYVRAYATNQAGTGYGNEITFTTPVATPTLTATPTNLAFGIVYQGAFSTEQSFTVTGVYLSPAAGNVTITSPPGYIISLTSGAGYASSLSLPYTGGTLGPLVIYIRFAPPQYGNYDGNMTINGGGAPPVSIALTGIGSQLPQAGTLTNMGVDFWTGYGYHSRMSNNNTASGPWMSLYISAKQAATVRVSLPGIADPSFPRTITIPANTSLEVTNFPQGDFNNNNDNPTGLPDARLYFTGITPRGIHIESLNGVPVAVYEHTYGQDAAGAMLLFPTNTWGATYNVVSLGGKSNSGVPNSFFFVMAAQDQTQIEITPTADIIDSSSATLFNSNTPAANILHPAGVPFTITLNKGQIFNAMARIVGSGSSGVSQDFTGTLVRSTDCNNKKIAVWAGNGRTFMNTSGCTVSSGSDNMVQQMFPRVAWGTKYLTTPTKTMEYGIYKICVLDPTTQVWFNNPTRTTPLTGLVNNFYYQVESNSPNLIESDKPIMVIQYIVTGNCKNNTFGNNGNGDPEMIILSPVQQAVNNISVFSAAKLNISSGASYINVAIKTSGVPSFKLDPVTNPTNVCDTGASSFTGTAYASAPIIPVANAFRPHPFATGYSVAKFKVASGVYHNLVSDSGFNAIAYGMAGGESYGYNAGTAIRDLSAIVQSLNPYDTVPGSKTCKGNPVRLEIAVPYLPSSIDSIKWDMGNNANIAPNGTFMQINPVPIRTYVDNEITYSVYNMTVPVVFNATGVYRVTATIFGTFSSECGNSQLIPIDMEVVSDTARFNFSTTGCTSTVVQFRDSSAAYIGGSIVSWQWNFGDATTYTGQNPPNHTFPAIGIYNVNIRTINNIGCFADTTRIVDLTGGLLANFGVAPDSIICTGNTITFSDSSTNTGPYGSLTVWHWNYGNGANVNASTNANQTYTYNTPGTYTATLQVETGNGCLSNIDSIHISVNAAPIITLTSAATTPNQTICVNNASSNITYALTGGATGATLSGTLPSGMTGSFSSGVFTISGTPTVTGTFNYTVTTVSTCTNVSLSGTITVIATPTITLTSATTTTAQTVCVNDAISNITYSIGGSSTGATVTGLPTGVTGVYNAGVFTISGTPTVSGVFNYTVTTVSPCTQVSLTGSITINALPTITLTSAASTSSQTVCANSAIVNIVYTFGGSATNTTLIGALPVGVTGVYNAGVFTISGTPTVSGVFNYTITSVSVCNNVSLSGTITVNALPLASFTFSNIRCTGDAVTFTDASTPNAASINQWQWVFGDGNTQTTTTPGTVTNTYGSATTFPVQLTITNSNGCISTPTIIQVTINPKPTTAFSFTDVCIPTGSAVFTDNSSIASGTINQWSWNFGDASPSVTSQNPTHIYTAGGTYNVTLTSTSALGCKKDSTRSIVVYNAPTASYTINNVGNVCSNTALNISNTSVVNGFGTINLVEIYWDFNGNPGLVLTDNTPTAGEVYTHNYPVFGTPATVTYKVLIKAYSGNGCVGEYYQDITVYAAPDVQFDPISPVCQEIPSVTLTSAFDVFNNTGVGTYSGDGITASPVLIPANAGTGNHTISYLFVASNGCRDSETQIITINPTPIFDLGPDRNILEGDQVALTPLTATGNGLSYLWSPGTYLSSVNIAAPVCAPTNDITYLVKIISADGCKAEDDLFVKVVRDFVVPNVFSPNGDGINDVWKIENLSLYPDYHIQIFNRYGQAMYDSKNYSIPWDGTIKGKPLPSGTYYYIIDLGGARKTKKGYVTIIR